MGRGTGTVAANAMGRTIGDLTAQNEETQRNELWNLVKAGQGAAGSIQNAGTNYASQIGSLNANYSDAMSRNINDLGIANANYYLAQGKNKSNLYSGLGDAALNAYSMYKMG
jgi:hypothetical protein